MRASLVYAATVLPQHRAGALAGAAHRQRRVNSHTAANTPRALAHICHSILPLAAALRASLDWRLYWQHSMAAVGRPALPVLSVRYCSTLQSHSGKRGRRVGILLGLLARRLEREQQLAQAVFRR